MKDVLKVAEISIPKIKSEYLKDFRSVRFESDKNLDEQEFWSVDCFMGGTDIAVGDEVKVSVQNMEDCNPTSLWNDGWINYFQNYLCTACKEDCDGYKVYDFYRPEVKVDTVGETAKPYSVIYGRTKEKFDVGESYVFCYRQIR